MSLTVAVMVSTADASACSPSRSGASPICARIVSADTSERRRAVSTLMTSVALPVISLAPRVVPMAREYSSALPQNCAVASFCVVISSPSATHLWPSNGRVSSSSTPLYALSLKVRTITSIKTKIAGCTAYMERPFHTGSRMITSSRTPL